MSVSNSIAPNGLQHIVFLCGCCSAGKTSLARAVLNLDPLNWFVVDEDAIYFTGWLRLFEKRFPKEFSIISEAIDPPNRFPAINNNLIIFKESASATLMDQARLAISKIQDTLSKEGHDSFKQAFSLEWESLTLSSTQEGLAKGKNVILDRGWISIEKVQRIFASFLVTKVLVFSSFSATLEKLERRNAEALASHNMSNFRFYLHLIRGYPRFYKVVTKSCHRALYSTTREALEALFVQVEKAIGTVAQSTAPPIVVSELTKEQFDNFKQQLLPRATPEGAVWIEPSDDYNLIIDTQKLTATQAAEALLAALPVAETQIGSMNSRDTERD